MHKKLLASLALLVLLTLLLAGCSIHTISGPTGPAVHMGSADFLQPSITISKGTSFTLIDDAPVQHVIANGTWVNGVPKPAKEHGAPTVNANFAGNDNSSVGPFPTAGTYNLYCTIHPGMNLKVIVR